MREDNNNAIHGHLMANYELVDCINAPRVYYSARCNSCNHGLVALGQDNLGLHPVLP